MTDISSDLNTAFRHDIQKDFDNKAGMAPEIPCGIAFQDKQEPSRVGAGESQNSADKKECGNAEFSGMVCASTFSIAVALTLFNRGLGKPATESQFKAWLSNPKTNAASQMIPVERLNHARSVFGQFLTARHS